MSRLAISSKVHPYSIIVCLVGIAFGITGITLAIIFGIKSSDSNCPTIATCQPCSNTPQNPQTTSCSAKLFSIRTGVDQTLFTWNASLNDPNSNYYNEVKTNLTATLTQNLQNGVAQTMASIFSKQLDAAAPLDYVVSVTKFEKASDSEMIIAYASAAATGNNSTITQLSDQDIVTQAENSLISGTNNVTVQPAVNADSMIFCSVPNTNLSSNGSDYMPSICPTLATLTPPTCDPPKNMTCPTCETTVCPTTICPSTECPTTVCPSTPPSVICSTPPATTPCNCPTLNTLLTTLSSTSSILSSSTSTSATSHSSSSLSAITKSTSSPPTNPTDYSVVTCPPPITCPTITPSCPTTCPICPTSQGLTYSTSMMPSFTTQTPKTSTLTSTFSTIMTSIPSSTCPPCQCTNPTVTTASSQSTKMMTTQSSGTTTSGDTAGTTTTPATTKTMTSASKTPIGTATSSSILTTSPGSILTGGTTSSGTIASTTGAFTSVGSTMTVTSPASITTTIPTTTTPSCTLPGTLVYNGDAVILFEAVNISDPIQLNQTNQMINTFIEMQILKYGTFGPSAPITQLGRYDFSDQITRMLLAPYPNTNLYNIPQSFITVPTNPCGFDANLFVFDIQIPYISSSEAKINDGLTWVQGINDTNPLSKSVIIIGISNQFVADAEQTSKALQNAGYHVFTVALNNTNDFSPLASDKQSAFTLQNPKDSAEAQRIATQIGNYLVQSSSKCIGATTTPPPTTPLSTIPITSVIPTTTDNCAQEYLLNSVIFLSEATNSTVSKELTMNFVINLYNKAESDLSGMSADWSTFSNFTSATFPNTQANHDLVACCDFGQLTQNTYIPNIQTQFYLGTSVYPSTSGINEGLVWSQKEFGGIKNGTIVLFANSADGVASSEQMANALKTSGISIITVAVGNNNFDLTSLSSPQFSQHNLMKTTDQNQLTNDIIADLKTLGTICVPN